MLETSDLKIGIIGGSGFYSLEAVVDKVKREVETPWGSPSGPLVEGVLEGVNVVVLARHGRGHTKAPGEVPYRANIWALKEAGVTHVLAATACGSLQEEISPGMFVLLDSFIDRTTGRAQSFHSSDGLPGVCHIPMEPAFCPVLRDLVSQELDSLGYNHKKTGTAVTIQGPRFSSRAESKMFRLWGADVVNMTTVPEVVLAKEAGLSYVSVALPTDYDCWRDGETAVDQQSVMAVFASNVSRVKTLVQRVVARAGREQESLVKVVKENRDLAQGSIVQGSDKT